MKKNDKETRIVLPGGEWENSVKEALDAAGIPFSQRSPRDYRFVLPDLEMVATIIRASDIPRAVANQKYKPVAGELIDVLICVLLLFHYLEYDIQLEFDRKMKKTALKYPL